jgi:hypothetical protein
MSVTERIDDLMTTRADREYRLVFAVATEQEQRCDD